MNGNFQSLNTQFHVWLAKWAVHRKTGKEV